MVFVVFGIVLVVVLFRDMVWCCGRLGIVYVWCCL